MSSRHNWLRPNGDLLPRTELETILNNTGILLVRNKESGSGMVGWCSKNVSSEFSGITS